MEKTNTQILNDSLSDLENGNFNNGIIQDNKLVFSVGDKSYRVRMPSQSEQAIVDNKRNIAQLEYIKTEGCITKKQLIHLLKEKSVFDVEQVEEQREALTKELKQYWFMLATKSSENKQGIEDLKVKINDVQNKLKSIAIDIATQLAPSLESRLEKFTVEYMCFLCTDVLNGKEWVRAWETFDDYKKEGSELTDRCSCNMTWILLNRRV